MCDTRTENGLRRTDPEWVGSLTRELGRVVAEVLPQLLTLSHQIHADPELRFEEHRAAAALCDALADEGFVVSKDIAGMETAFRAERKFGTGGPTIAVFCEYDALQGIGHACGHNIIAAAGAGAGIVASRWLEIAGGVNGSIVVLGSPGEEGGGGKTYLIREGALAGVDAAVMVHPAGYNAVARPNLSRVSLEVEFAGRASHAAAAPEQGLNALDAATLFLVALGLLRQQLRADSRVHAIIVEGGEAVNIIPERTRVEVFVRSPDPQYLRSRLYKAVQDCAEGAAQATGNVAKVSEVAPAYESVISNPVIGDLVAAALAAVGRPPEAETGSPGSAGSTDMGNVSRIVPAIHPYISVTPDLPIHSRKFEEAAGAEPGDKAVADGATVLAAVVVGLLERPSLVQSAHDAFARQCKEGTQVGRLS